MPIPLNWKTLESALIEWAGAGGVMMGVPSLGMRDREQAHKFAELAIPLRPNHKVPVVRHQTVADNSNRQQFVRSLNNSLHSQKILLIIK
jgi:hypothetical protein